jgi:hypothetical protein
MNMDQMSKQTETLKTRKESNVAQRIVSVIFGLIEIILVFRFIFKFLGANEDNGFVKAIYTITNFFVKIFEGIFANVTIGSLGVFEPASLIAIIVVALVAWLVLALLAPRKTSRVEKTKAVEAPKPEEPKKPDDQNKP